MDIKAIQARLAAHAVERNWDPFFSPRSLSMAVAGEAGALVAIFQWLSEDQARRVGKTHDRDTVADSVADIVLYALRLAETVDFDLEEAVLARAAKKYPVSARRFEGVDDMDARERTPAPRAATQAGSNASAQAAPVPRQADFDGSRTPPRAAPAREEPLKPAPPPPVRAPTAKAVEADPEKTVEIDVDPPEVAAALPPDRAGQSRGRPEPAVREQLEPPRRSRPEPPARERPAPPARVEPPRAARYADLDTNAILDMVKGLKKRIDDSRSDDAVLHEIKDEMDTLRRNVYSSKSKPAWIAGGLERLRGLLEEAAVHPVGDKVNFKDFIVRISGMLEQ